jgi:hypothetical protein
VKRHIEMHGAYVEEDLGEAQVMLSAQGIINPDYSVEVMSTHEHQIDKSGTQATITFPSRVEYRETIIEYARKIGNVLAQKGGQERFEVTFVVTQGTDGTD